MRWSVSPVLVAALCVGLVSCGASRSGPGDVTPLAGSDAVTTVAGTPSEVGPGRASCPVTPPPQPPFVPPKPYPAIPSPGSNDGRVWYGSDELWTVLDPDGILAMARDETGVYNKSFWWRSGFDPSREQTPGLTLTARRLDVPEPEIPASSGDATNGWTDNNDLGAFMLTEIRLPTTGCWKITGHYGIKELSFQAWVA